MNYKDVILITLRNILPPKWYLSLRYYIIFKKIPDWNNPRSFTEKLQWLKLYGRKPEYTIMVDKVKAKEYVGRLIGEEFIIPTYCVWDRVQDIDISHLPKEFVLKTNHASGDVIICRDKNKFDINGAKKRLAEKLSEDYWRMGMEIAYRDVPKKIFAETLLPIGSDGELLDYKFFCFDGSVKFFKINFNKEANFSANYYDLDFNLLPFGEKWPAPDPSEQFHAPVHFDRMVDIAERLSEGMPFARIDMYNIDGQIFFGEITLYPTSGFGAFNSAEYDNYLGDMINLPVKK